MGLTSQEEIGGWGTGLAQWEEQATLDLGVLSSSPSLGV